CRFFNQKRRPNGAAFVLYGERPIPRSFSPLALGPAEPVTPLILRSPRRRSFLSRERKEPKESGNSYKNATHF
ncbi:MAG: hypothetical protein II804_07985, partial [Clostridia bacterium]|nr:hypothetical protein [Clostridia bacterium]